MALVKCPDCGKMVSPRARQCPFCGCPAEFFIVEEENSSSYDKQEQETCIEKQILSGSKENSTIDEQIEEREDNEQPYTKKTPTDKEEVNGAIFGLQTEQFPDPNKYPFAVIVDAERESDKHAKGKTHVMFRVGNEKYLTVLKDNLFYAPIEKYVDDKRITAKNEFGQYLDGVTSLSGMTSEAKDIANDIIIDYCQFLVEKLIHYGIYEYDIKNFTSFCGSEILIEDTDSYRSILRQENNVDTYAQDLAYQRDLERSSRSRWSGGGFGVRGAIKGAVTAGALNATMGAFRSIGDSMSNAGDRSNVQSRYNAIVNDKNKRDLLNDFSRRCLYSAKVNFYSILAKRTGWSATEVLGGNWKETNAKLNNLGHIKDKSAREKILIELLSDHPYHYGVLDYAISNYDEYGFDLVDLLHFVKRISLDAFEIWMKKHFSDSLRQIEKNKNGEERKHAIIDLGVALGVIDENLNVVQREDAAYGAEVIMSLIEANMSGFGLSIKGIVEQTKDYDQAQYYFEKLAKIGSEYHVFNNNEVNNEIEITGLFANNGNFIKLRDEVNKQLKRICTVRGVLCKDIQEAKLLTSEWEEFDQIYSPFDSYADYDSHIMQEVIDRAKSKNFSSKYVLDLISGNMGLISKKRKLEEREKSDGFEKSQILVKRMIPYAENDLFVYGSNGFLEKAKTVRGFDKIKQQEDDIFPLVIYDASDSNSFKGFVITDKYFYNYNSMWGMGFGDKAISLYDVQETAQNGKNRLFRLSNGKIKKLRIIGYEYLIISMLSEIFAWASDLSKVPADTPNTESMETDKPMESSAEPKEKKCPKCNGLIAINAKFCTFCGNKLEGDEVKEDRETCPSCGKKIRAGAKFCGFCGTNISRMNEEVSDP